MTIFSEEQTNAILKIAQRKIGDKYQKGYNCETFVREVYAEAGVTCNFAEHPVLSIGDVYSEKFLGYLCFLKHKKHGKERRFTHVGIIAPNHHLVHYSRYFGEPNVREVFLTPFQKIFEVYDFAEVIFTKNHLD